MEKGWLEGQACSQLYCDLSLVEGQAMLFQTVHQYLQCLLHVQQPGTIRHTAGWPGAGRAASKLLATLVPLVGVRVVHWHSQLAVVPLAITL